jgi:hypothetical protein
LTDNQSDNLEILTSLAETAATGGADKVAQASVELSKYFTYGLVGLGVTMFLASIFK